MRILFNFALACGLFYVVAKVLNASANRKDNLDETTKGKIIAWELGYEVEVDSLGTWYKANGTYYPVEELVEKYDFEGVIDGR